MLGQRRRCWATTDPTFMTLVHSRPTYKNTYIFILNLFQKNEMNRALGHLCAHIG